MWEIEPLKAFYVGALPDGIVTGGVLHTSDGMSHPVLQYNGKPVVATVAPGDELMIHVTIGQTYVGLVVAITILHSLGPLRFSFEKPFTYEGEVPLLFNIKAKKFFELPESKHEGTH
jgi:hypothetical protein